MLSINCADGASYLQQNNLDIIEIDKDLIKDLNNKFLKYKFVNIINNDVIKCTRAHLEIILKYASMFEKSWKY